MRIVEGKTDREMAHIVFSRFSCGDTKDGIKYSLGGLYVHPFVTRVSREALIGIGKICPQAIVRGKGVDYKKLQVRKMGITREHVIPVTELYEHLIALPNLTEQCILDFMAKLEIALISDQENDKLKAAGFHSAMPDGWWDTSGLDPFDRYRAAGLDDSIWIKNF